MFHSKKLHTSFSTFEKLTAEYQDKQSQKVLRNYKKFQEVPEGFKMQLNPAIQIATICCMIVFAFCYPQHGDAHGEMRMNGGVHSRLCSRPFFSDEKKQVYFGKGSRGKVVVLYLLKRKCGRKCFQHLTTLNDMANEFK